MTQKFKNFIFSRTFIGIIVGSFGGFLYYYFIGCTSGSCPITSNPYASILYGALFGGVLFYKPTKKINKNNKSTVN